jgi:hypothetical protein
MKFHFVIAYNNLNRWFANGTKEMFSFGNPNINGNFSVTAWYCTNPVTKYRR